MIMRRDGSSIAEKIVFLEDEVEPQILSIIRNATKYVKFVTPYLGL